MHHEQWIRMALAVIDKLGFHPDPSFLFSWSFKSSCRCRSTCVHLTVSFRLATVQDARPPQIPSLAQECKEVGDHDKMAILESIRTMIPDHETRVQSLEVGGWCMMGKIHLRQGYACMWACTHPHVHVPTQTQKQTHTHTHAHACTCKHTHTHWHRQIHMHTHTQSCLHTPESCLNWAFWASFCI